MAAKLLWMTAGIFVCALAGALVWHGDAGLANVIGDPPTLPSLKILTRPTETPTQTATQLPTDTPLPTATPTKPPPTATPKKPPTRVSEVAPVVQTGEPPPPPPPEPVRRVVLGGTRLGVPRGTSVVWGGCASDGTCYPYNFYWAPTLEAVLHAGQSPLKVQHELCHAHQHLSINGGLPLRPSDYDLESWYQTAEGRSYASAVAGDGWPWPHSGPQNLLEDFAWACAYWYSAPGDLLDLSPIRYQWAETHLP